MANQQPGFMKMLRNSLPAASSPNEGHQKAANEAISGEILGRFTKEARQEIAGVSAWAGNAYGANVAKALGPTLDKMAHIAGALVQAVEYLNKFATTVANGGAPMDSHGFPKMDPDKGLQVPFEHSPNQDTALEVRSPTGEGWKGEPGLDAERERMLRSNMETHGQVSGSSNNPPVIQDTYSHGQVRTASALDGLISRLQKAAWPKPGAIGEATSKVQQFVGKHKGAIGGAVGGAVGGAAAGFAAGRMSKKDEGTKESSADQELEQLGAEFDAGIADALAGR